MTAKEYFLSIREERDAWANSQVQACMYCGLGDMPLEIHEMRRRGKAPREWGQTCNYLLLCTICHSKVFAAMPIEQQLSVKFTRDQKHFIECHPLFFHANWKQVRLLPLPALRPQRMPAF